MRYLVLATDYDGTLAHNGRVLKTTLDCLEKLKASGRKIVLVTGRELPDLFTVFPELEIFDLVVAENGALLYNPESKEQRALAEPPDATFVQRLRDRDVPVSVGAVIVATWEPFREQVVDTIREVGLELQVIFNKGAVMVLPTGINKATGLRAALETICLSRHNTVAIGDAENDHAFLADCECSAAVANALPALKERADVVTERDHGAGVEDLAERLLRNDLSDVATQLHRHDILLGAREDGTEVRLHPYGANVLIAGSSGGGKSTLTTGLLERLHDSGYQFCLIDPEGDYPQLETALVIGDPEREPTATEVITLLEKPQQSVVVNLLGVHLEKRPDYFQHLFPRIQEVRLRLGHPHWLVVDEAHHVWPVTWQQETALAEAVSTMLITLDPLHISDSAIRAVDTIIAVGEYPQHTINAFCERAGISPPDLDPSPLPHGQAVIWSRSSGVAPVQFSVAPARSQRVRHSRKYAQGELDEGRSFYFRGPEGKLKLRARNLVLFLEIMEGVDDNTWLYHLHRHDYSHWFRKEIKSDDLAADAERIEADKSLGAGESRSLIRKAIEERYTLPV